MNRFFGPFLFFGSLFFAALAAGFPSMDVIFVESNIFEKQRSSYLTEEEFKELQLSLLANPKAGRVIQGTGGLRKLRFGSKGKGKRSGVRVIYYYFDLKRRFYFLTLCSKNEVTDLTLSSKKTLKQLMEAWQNEQT